MKKAPLFSIGALSMLCNSASLVAADFTATESGDWTDPQTWGQASTTPGAGDVAYFNDGVTVTLDESLDFSNIGWKNSSGGANAILNITGSGTVVNLTSNTNLYYNMRLDWNITDGATVTSAGIAWGSGGYSNISVLDANFTVANFSQLRGSKVGDGSRLLVKGTMYDDGGVMKSSANMTVNSNFTLDPNESGDTPNSGGKMTVEVDGGIFNVTGNTSLSPASAETAATVNVKGGGIQASTGSFYVSPTGENSRAIANVSDGGKITAGSNVFVGGSNATAFAQLNVLSGGIVESTGEIALQSAATRELNVAAGGTVTTQNGFTIRGSGTATANIAGTFTAASSVYVQVDGIGNLNVIEGGKLNIGTLNIENRANGTNIVSVFGQNSAINVTGSIVIGNAVQPGSVAKLRLGGYDENNNFVAASAKAVTNTWIANVNATGTLEILLGDSNAVSAITANDSGFDGDHAIFYATFFKTVLGDFKVDLTNVDGLAAGTYYFALISSTEELRDGYVWSEAIDWSTQMSVTDGAYAKYTGYEVVTNGRNGNRGETLYIEVEVIPEPSTYALVIGALSLAFAAYRRRK